MTDGRGRRAPSERRRIALRGPGPRVRLVVLTTSVVALFLVLLISGSLSPEKVRDRVDGFGAAGPAVFIAVSAGLTCLMFPGPILAGASGLLFGTLGGTPIALASTVLGACAACLIGRFVAGDAVEELGGPRLQALAAWISRRGFLSVLTARLTPLMPYNLVNYAAGLTTIPVLTFGAGTAVGTAPRTFAYVALGGSFGDLGSPEALVALTVIISMGIVGLWLMRRDILRERADRAAGADVPAPSTDDG